MRIPLSAPDITDVEIQAVVQVLRTSQLSLGPKLKEFERAVADYAGAPYAVAVNSGTSGLHLSLRALGTKAGDEVITASFSFIASANVILYENAIPVFVDIDSVTRNIAAERIEAAITAQTRAILVVHAFGRPAPMGEIMRLAARYNLVVIEDACEAIGAKYGERMAGAIGDAGVFAFYPNKQITTGEGGMIVTHNEAVAKMLRIMRNQGRGISGISNDGEAVPDWFEHTHLGYNYRLSDVNCALGTAQLGRISQILTERQSVAHRYQENLRGHPDLVLPEIEIVDGRISWFVYVVGLSDAFTRGDRDQIVREMHRRGIGCGRYFAPIHLQPFYRQTFGYKPGDFPITERIAERTIALPFFNRITDNQIAEVCQTLTTLIEMQKQSRQFSKS